jgi:hypothetical protein
LPAISLPPGLPFFLFRLLWLVDFYLLAFLVRGLIFSGALERRSGIHSHREGSAV